MKNKLTKNFYAYEFDCKDGTTYPREWFKDRLIPLVKDIQKIRDQVGPLTIVSGYRTTAHNKKVGGSKGSRHMQGDAVDLFPHNVTFAKLKSVILDLVKKGEIKDGGIGWGIGGVNKLHYDHGPRRRWTYKS